MKEEEHEGHDVEPHAMWAYCRTCAVHIVAPARPEEHIVLTLEVKSSPEEEKT
jgi:hypothetical protein